MGWMFSGCNELTSVDVSSFNTSNVTVMQSMFRSCYKLSSLDVSGFDTSKVFEMSDMFAACSELTSLDLHNFKACVTASVTNIPHMFEGCVKLTSIKMPNIKAGSMNKTFWYCTKLQTVDLSGLDISNTPQMEKTFSQCGELTTVYVSDSWKITDSTIPTYDMFEACVNLVGENGTKYDSAHTDGEYARVDKAGAPGYFTLKSTTLETGDLTGDGAVGIDDAQLTLKAYTEKFAGKETGLTDAQIKSADVNGDGELTVEDAQLILKYYTEKNVAGKDIKWDDLIKK